MATTGTTGTTGQPSLVQQPGRQASPDLAERPARRLPGWPMVGVALLLLALGVALLSAGARARPSSGPLLIAGIIVIIAGLLAVRGLTPVTPGHARVLLLLGRYTGTIRSDGLHWVNPFANRVEISTRVRNHETAVAKVNDADGNPIEMAAVVVWRVQDTAKAAFGVDNLAGFIAIQAETAVRRIATRYPYDGHGGETLSLRENAQEITGELAAEIAARVVPAGVEIIESRVSRLSYASEIAQAMLRRQQAGAVVAARQRIVDGAVGMVQQALTRLAQDDIVDLDEERKAAMVSNLLVVLCSEHSTQPVVNTGTLYQ
jgi:regulator of protease activity HflC (stomatin/prohibitin superfamily)